MERNLPQTKTNSEAPRQNNDVKNSIQQHQEFFPPLQFEWPLGTKVLVNSSRASPQKRHRQKMSVESGE
jgi:hypothetical protein